MYYIHSTYNKVIIYKYFTHYKCSYYVVKMMYVYRQINILFFTEYINLVNNIFGKLSVNCKLLITNDLLNSIKTITRVHNHNDCHFL